jgi:hypothetical protein
MELVESRECGSLRGNGRVGEVPTDSAVVGKDGVPNVSWTESRIISEDAFIVQSMWFN